MYAKKKIKTIVDLNHEQTGLEMCNYYTLINTGLYGDKFASLLDSLFNAIRDTYLTESSQNININTDNSNGEFYPEFVKQRWMTAKVCYFFINSIRIPNNFSKNLNNSDHVVKNQYGEVCICRSQVNSWSDKLPIYVIRMIARTIKTLTAMQCTYAHINSQLKDNPFLASESTHDPVRQKLIDVNGNEFIVSLNEEREDVNADSMLRMNDKIVRIQDKNGLICTSSSPRYPYRKIIESKLKEYWIPASEKPSFLGNGFTCRDVYLAYCLLIGTSKKTLLKHYTQSEIDEMVGKPHDPLTAETISTTITEICLKREDLTQKARNLAQELADRVDLLYKKLIDDSKAEYKKTLNEYFNEYIEIQKSQLSALKELDIIYDDFNWMKNITSKQSWLI